MGKTGVEKRRKKKKGRPSLLDLEKRSLRQQQQQQQLQQQQVQSQDSNHHHKRSNPNPNSKDSRDNSNPYLRFPNSIRRATRRSPNQEEEEDEEEEEEDEGGKRREKKLKLVLKLPPNGRQPAAEWTGLDSSGSEEEGNGGGMRTRFKKRQIDAVDAAGSATAGQKTERHNSIAKVATDGDLLNSETTPLPDKKLLVFILDRLQKKDTYGVFAEPVDPNELPDYHDIIKHPMDFSTVRKKVANGLYANLEQFEEDVFLISSNAMRYNSPDTIYFRQARSIQELAKKNFVNLRQESDDNEPEPKVVRRGRPPSKNTVKKPVGRPPTDHSNFNVSLNATTANASIKDFMPNSSNDVLRKGSTSDRAGIVDSSARAPYARRHTENYSWMSEKKSEANEEHSGSILKGLSTRYGKKVIISEENRRNTYNQPSLTTIGREPSILTTFDGERRELLPVGLHMEHSYARSLARFAANLGSVGWEIAATQIERVLPTATKFGRGWVGEKDAPQQSQPLRLSTSSVSPQPVVVQSPSTSKSDHVQERMESSSNILAADGNQPCTSLPASSTAPTVSNITSDTAEAAVSSKAPVHDCNFKPPASAGFRPTAPFQLQHTSLVQPTVNGFNAGFVHDHRQLSHMAKSAGPSGTLSSDAPMTHARVLDMVSRSNSTFAPPSVTGYYNVERTKMGNPGMANPKNTFFHTAVASQLDTERLNLGSSNPVNFSNNFIHPTNTKALEAQKIRQNNPSQNNTVDRAAQSFSHSAARQPEMERAKSNNLNAMDSGNRIINSSEASRHIESQRVTLGNSDAINSVTSFTRGAGTGTATGRSEPETTKFGSAGTIKGGSNSQGFWRNTSFKPRPDSVPPDLNVRFQSPGSPPSTVLVDSQQPDLALQL